MVGAQKLLGVNVMAPHWEFTLGAERVKEIVEKDFKGSVDFVAQNVKTTDFGDQVFKPYTMKVMNGVQVAIIGQAFPYTPWPTAPFHAGLDFRYSRRQSAEVCRRSALQGAKVVVVLSHNGMDVDLKWLRA